MKQNVKLKIFIDCKIETNQNEVKEVKIVQC